MVSVYAKGKSDHDDDHGQYVRDRPATEEATMAGVSDETMRAAVATCVVGDLADILDAHVTMLRESGGVARWWPDAANGRIVVEYASMMVHEDDRRDLFAARHVGACTKCGDTYDRAAGVGFVPLCKACARTEAFIAAAERIGVEHVRTDDRWIEMRLARPRTCRGEQARFAITRDADELHDPKRAAEYALAKLLAEQNRVEHRDA